MDVLDVRRKGVAAYRPNPGSQDNRLRLEATRAILQKAQATNGTELVEGLERAMFLLDSLAHKH